MLTTTALNASSTMATARTKIDEMIVRYDGWFLVVLAVLMVLAFAMLASLPSWWH
ncbi:hypothetical protein AB4068_13435 [Arthrobacter sp. 2RAF22]|uniref:hypothetical protein n=1 Tax=Arthrobacter sp. 2RAF22 TaxID=3232996 RepID=UPI003F93D3DA